MLVADREIPSRPIGPDLSCQPLIDLPRPLVVPLSPIVIPAGLIHIPELIVDHRSIARLLPDADLLLELAGELQCFLRCPDRRSDVPVVPLKAREPHERFEISCPVSLVLVRVVVFPVFVKILIRRLFLPPDRFLSVRLDALPGGIHIHQLLRRFGAGFCFRATGLIFRLTVCPAIHLSVRSAAHLSVCPAALFRCPDSRSAALFFAQSRLPDQRDCLFMVRLHIDPRKIRKADEKGVLRILFVRGLRYFVQRFHKSAVKFRPSVLVFQVVDGLVRELLQFLLVNAPFGIVIHFHRNDPELFLLVVPVPRPFVFIDHYIVAFFLKVGRDAQRKEPALCESVFDRFIIALAGDQELVVPDRYVAVFRVLVDQPHQPLRVIAVLLAVTHKNIGVEGRAHFSRQLVTHEHGVQECFQDLLVRRRCGVIVITRDDLDLGAVLAERAPQPFFQSDRKDRDMLFDRRP